MFLVIATTVALGTLLGPANSAAALAAFKSEFIVQASFAPTTTPGVLAGTTSGTGHASHLGRVTLSTTELLDFTAGDGTATIRDGRMVMTASNGDQLHWTYSGQVSEPEAGIVTLNGTFDITGGTGRFSDATGGGTFTGEANITTGIASLSYAGSIQ